MMNLSEQQIPLIVSTWKKDDFNWLYEIGMSIYCEIFRLEPSVKIIFPYVAEFEKQHKDVKESKQFRAQALRFVQALGMAVSTIGENDPTQNEFDDILFQLGVRHKKFADRGFKAEFWDVFDRAVVHVMEHEYATNSPKLNELQRKIAAEGWRVLSDYIIAGMKKGFIS